MDSKWHPGVTCLENSSWKWVIVLPLPCRGNCEAMAIVFPKLWKLCALGLHLLGFLIDKTLIMLVWGPAVGFLVRSWERTAINVQQTFKCMRSYVLITWPAVWPSKPLQ